MEPEGRRRLLQGGERDPSLDHRDAAGGIDLLDCVECAEIADELVWRGDRAADETRPPALRHESAALRPAPRHQLYHLRDRAGTNEREGVQIAGVPAGIARGERIAVEHLAVRQMRAQGSDPVRRGSGRYVLNAHRCPSRRRAAAGAW